MKYLSLLLVFLATTVFAEFDYRFTARGRTYPVSAVMEADAGYNKLLWGERSGVLYGFIRPTVSVQEIGTYHNGSLALDVYPISFVKMKAGVSREISHGRRTDVNCEQLECQGRINHKFAETTLLLGAKSYFSQLRFRLNSSKRNDGTKNFLEYETMLPMDGRQDESTLFQGVLGKNLDPSWSVLYVNLLGASDKAKGSMTSHYALGMYTQGAWEFAAGAGAFRSSLLDWGFSGLFWMTWTGKESFALTKNSKK